jgi:predicted transcriptional regulator
MSYEESLREKIQAALETEHPANVLEQVMALLEKPLIKATAEEETAIGAGIADIQAGRFYTLDEFNQIGDLEQKERRLKYME